MHTESVLQSIPFTGTFIKLQISKSNVIKWNLLLLGLIFACFVQTQTADYYSTLDELDSDEYVSATSGSLTYCSVKSQPYKRVKFSE